MLKRILLVALACAAAAAASAQSSYYTARLDDPKAVYLDAMGARGDGVNDDTAAIQAAIDRVQEAVGQGIVFVSVRAIAGERGEQALRGAGQPPSRERSVIGLLS